MSETWNESAENAVDIIFSMVRKRGKVSPELLRSGLDTFISSLYDRRGGYQQAVVHLTIIGADSVEIAKKRGIIFDPASLTATLIGKQRDYGKDAITRFGRQGLLVRLHDKVARLENLDGGGRQPSNESVADTLMDIVGYCALGIIWEQGEFGLPLV